MAMLNAEGTALTYVTYFGGRLDETRERECQSVATVPSTSQEPRGRTTSFEPFDAYQSTCPILQIVGGCLITFVMKFAGGRLGPPTYLRRKPRRSALPWEAPERW